MGCCGKARANLSISHANSGPPSTPIHGGARPPASPLLRVGANHTQPIELRYSGAAGIIVRGPATGKQYAFSATAPGQAVDPSDAAILLRTNRFMIGKIPK
jgi:hypothetical protein